MGTTDFELSNKKLLAFFRTFPLGLYDGIIGMDSLIVNHASIHCAKGSLTFNDNLGHEILVQGKFECLFSKS